MDFFSRKRFQTNFQLTFDSSSGAQPPVWPSAPSTPPGWPSQPESKQSRHQRVRLRQTSTSYVLGHLTRRDHPCYDRGIPFLGENGFLNDLRHSLTQNRRKWPFFLRDSRCLPRGHGSFHPVGQQFCFPFKSVFGSIMS